MIRKLLLATLILVITAGALYWVFYPENVLEFVVGVNKNLKEVKKADIGQTISKISSEILAPTPLNVGGAPKNTVLLKSKIILETNIARQENGGLLALKENQQLYAAALTKANDMFLNQYFEHESPTGVDPGSLIKAHGYQYITVGENLILGNFASEKEVVDAWMNSPGHRANILNNRYTEIGVAVVKGTYQGDTVWIGVQEFGLPMAACPHPDEQLKDKIDVTRAQLEQIGVQIEELKKQIDQTDSRSDAYEQMVDDYNALVAKYNALVQETKDNISTYNVEVNTFNNCVAGN